MKNKLNLISKISIGLLVVASQASFAGYKANNEVLVNGTTISGSFGSARNSSDASQVMYITKMKYGVRVWARNSSNVANSCVASDPMVMTQLNSASSSSYISVKHTGGECTSVYVSDGSQFPPKKL